MDRNTLFDCLVAWVNTFNLNVKCEGANDFKDGILIAKCLNNIDPEYFDEDWLSKIKDDTNDNWRLKLLNLKKILQRITDYYSEVLNHSLSDFEMPNLNLIVETNNNTTSVEANNQLSHLLQLVLGCAVNCERKSEFIKNIMEMNESTQHMIMTAIQELMSKDRNMNLIRQSTSSLSLGGVVGGTMSTSASMIASTTTASGGEADIDLAYQLKRAQVEISRLGELKEDIELKCQRLDKQVSELIEEKTSLASEIDFLRNKLQRHEDGDRSDPTNDINKQLRLQQKVDSMQEELYRLESEKEKYRIQFEAAKSEQDILLEKNIELKKVAQEHQNLRDEIDVLKHRSDRVEKLESTIESYKIKLEEMVDLKRQIKSLEENNTKYLEKILLMEEEVKKINALKSQIEMYKKQIQELHEQMLNDEMKSKKLEYEYKSLEERLNSLRAEKERLQSEYEKVKENLDKQIINNSNTNPALNDENGQPLTTMPTNDEEGSNQLMGDLFSTAELFNIPSDIKEKLVRLCHENKVLKSKQTEYNEERYFLIQSQLEDEKQRSGDLQTRLNETSKQKIEIECQLNDLRKTSKDLLEAEQHSRNATNPAVDSSRDELINDLKTKLGRAQAQLDDESKRNETALKSLEEKLELLSVEKNELKESREKELKAHEKEIKEMNEKYRGYLEKAKIVIKTLDPRNSTNGCSEMQFLKTQLAEKEKQIKQLMKENDKIRNSRDLEERLVTSAWQKLSSTLNRRSTDERVSSVGSSSFLSQQRHMPNSNNSSNSSTSSNNSATSVSGSPSSGPGLIHHSLSATNTPRQRSSNSFLSSLPKLNSPTPTN